MAEAKALKLLLSRKEAATYLESIGCRISVSTLANMAAGANARKGPPFTRFRWRTVVYARPDLDAWAKSVSHRVE